MACLLLAYPSSAARQQDKSADVSDADRIYKQSEIDEKPVIDKLSREANYPSAQGCEGQGSVLLLVVLRKTGKVTDVVVREKGGCSIFEKRAIKAVQKTKFKPAKKDGVAVSTYMMFQFNYHVW